MPSQSSLHLNLKCPRFRLFYGAKVIQQLLLGQIREFGHLLCNEKWGFAYKPVKIHQSKGATSKIILIQ